MKRLASVALPLAGGFLALHLAAASVFNVVLPDEFNKVVDTNTVLVTNGFVNCWKRTLVLSIGPILSSGR